MADRGSFGLAPRLDIQQLFIEAQHRWLRPAEICEILRNYEKFHISTEPPNKPASGSLFLFDRKVLRYFRKDGHNWRKKKDGKTVKEAHEKLKVGSVDVLHCYYAHGEETESFQRRSYWMLEQELMHIVFVHYLEVKGNRTHSSPSNSLVNHNRSGNTDSVSPSSTLSSAFEDADSADSHQTTGTHSFYRPQPLQNNVTIDKVDVGPSSTHLSHSRAGPGSPVAYGHGSGSGINDSSSNIINSQGLASWEDVYEQSTRGFDNTPLRAAINSTHLGNYGVGANMMQPAPTGSATQVNFDGSLPIHSTWQIPAGDSSLHFPHGMDATSDLDLAYDFGTRLFDQRTQDFGTHNTLEPYFTGSLQQHDQLLHNNLHIELLNSELQYATGSYLPVEGAAEGNGRYALFAKKPLLGEEGLKKVDSFSRWVSKELGEVDDLNMKSSSGIAWSNVECGNVADESVLSPSLSQDQLFSIMDFSPKWAYADSGTEVHIVGMFLKSQEEVQKCEWSCMFGEVEVRAEVLADGVLCCFAPPHGFARVPLYVTCSNRVACSEVREFDYLLILSLKLFLKNDSGWPVSNIKKKQAKQDRKLASWECQPQPTNPHSLRNKTEERWELWPLDDANWPFLPSSEC